MTLARSLFVLLTLILAGCMSTKNSSLGKPVADISKAEIVGSKIKLAGALPHRIWAVTIDGKSSPLNGFPWDKVYSLDPGARKITVQYEGAVMNLLGTTPRGFSAQTEFVLDAAPGIRYRTKGKYREGEVTLWIEEYSTEKIVCPAVTVPVTLLDSKVMVY